MVANCVITEGSNKVTLPEGTDISQQYGNSPDTWKQWDLIRPLMYVTCADNNDKYKWLPEGTFVQSMEWIPAGGSTSTLAFANETVGAISGNTYGVTNNGSDVGTVTLYTEGITTAYTQTTFYYNCETHVGMAGTIVINSAVGIANTYTIDVTASGTSDYVFTGSDRNGSFTTRIGGNFNFNEGDIIVFNVNASTHNFLLKFASGIGLANQITSYTAQTGTFFGVVGNVSIAASGPGIGSSGGFNTGQNYIWFSEDGLGSPSNQGERSVAFTSINATGLTSIEIDSFIGTNSNGGEFPDVIGANGEHLELRYSLDAYNVGFASATWVSIGQIIPIQAQPNVTGVATYTLSIPAAARQANTTFQLYQPSNTGVDNYGITNLRYVGGGGLGNYEVTLSQNMGQGDVEVPAGWGTATLGLKFRDGTYPTSLNTSSTAKDPLEAAFSSHNHGSFEIGQTLGTMVGPPSHTAVNADGSALAAQSIDNALNIAVDTTQPSLTMTFIIKAY